MTLARELGYTVIEQTLPREMLYIADEVFFTGTAAEITPIRSVDRIVVGKGKARAYHRRSSRSASWRSSRASARGQVRLAHVLQSARGGRALAPGRRSGGQQTVPLTPRRACANFGGKLGRLWARVGNDN